MAFCAGVKRPYQRTETGMSPCRTAPLWYVSWFGWGWTRNMSFLVVTDAAAMFVASTSSSRMRRFSLAIWAFDFGRRFSVGVLGFVWCCL